MPRTLDSFETLIDEYLKELCRHESTQSSVNAALPPAKRSILGRFGSWFMRVATYEESHLDTLIRKNPYFFSDLMM